MISQVVSTRARFAAVPTSRPVRASRRVVAHADPDTKSSKTAAGDLTKPSLVDGAGVPAVPSTSSYTSGAEYAQALSGISGPFGYFDPFGLAASTTPEQVKRYRESEITHGRVCMLAAVGILVGEAVEGTTLFYNWDGGISGPAIIHFQQTKQGFWEPLVLFIGIAEAFRVAIGWADPTKKGVFTLKDEYRPGDLGFDPLGLAPTDKASFDSIQTKEINNGRLAMIATAGFVAQELVNGKGIVETLQAKL